MGTKAVAYRITGSEATDRATREHVRDMLRQDWGIDFDALEWRSTTHPSGDTAMYATFEEQR